MKRVPVTILTGFLGSGKTTLLNRILREQHGKRIAVIENEFGEIGIDHDLVINADEEVFEMANGCVCCTVRGDLIRILGKLTKRRDKFDYVLLETTGLADPGPVAQTFFTDDDVRDEYVLDGIVTVVDAYHIGQQLAHSDESSEQIAFADVIVLNKTDLVPSDDLASLEARLRTMNRAARILRSQHADVPVEAVLNLNAFDLDQILSRRPSFLEPEYPFEWTGTYLLEPGCYNLSLGQGPDPAMSVVVLAGQGIDDASLRQGAERCVRRFAEPPVPVLPDGPIPLDVHAVLQPQARGRSSFFFDVGKRERIGIFTQHGPDEFGLRLSRAHGSVSPPGEPEPIRPVAERSWILQHEHDNEIGSVAIEADGDVDPETLSLWMADLLRAKGADIFRMKGFISLAGESRRFVLQGVHMFYDGQPDRPWGADRRRNQIVFIGRNLDGPTMIRGFNECLL